MSADLYFIALVPPEPVREQVHALKLEIKQRFGAGHALRSPAHITLIKPFRLQSEFRVNLVEVLGQMAVLQHPFTIMLEGFDCFIPRVIFIKVRDPEPVINLGRNLKKVLVEKQFVDKGGTNIPFHPHMTIATRDLEEPAFVRAWAEFKNRNFRADFEVSSLFLLRHHVSYWTIFQEFEFGRQDSSE